MSGFRSAAIFEIDAHAAPTAGGLAVFGAPYDCTTSFRPGTRSGPAGLRAVSFGVEYYSPEQDAELGDLALVDLGDLDLTHGSAGPVMGQVREAVGELLAQDLRPVMIGGEHSLTAGAVEAVAARFPDLVVIQLDAHADLRDGYLGEHYSHASAMRRCLDALKPNHMLQVGIRSGTREEFAEMRAAKRLIPTEAAALREALARFPDQPIYLTIDLDVFDPAAFPGTGTPEAGGIFWPTFAALLAELPGDRLVAADLMELSPPLDASGCSAVLAAKALREVLLKMGSKCRFVG